MATQASKEMITISAKAPHYGLVHALLLIRILIDEQQLILTNKAGETLLQYPVSTSLNGCGNTVDSGKTPLGLHGIVERYGAGQPQGVIFSSRRLRPERWRGEPCEDDLISTRILRLAGLEPELNGHSYQRYIYIHGSPHEEMIGTACSGGCIRLNNRDMEELFERCVGHDVLCLIQ